MISPILLINKIKEMVELHVSQKESSRRVLWLLLWCSSHGFCISIDYSLWLWSCS